MIIDKYFTSNGDLHCKQSNHKTDKSMKTGQSVAFISYAIQIEFMMAYAKSETSNGYPYVKTRRTGPRPHLTKMDWASLLISIQLYISMGVT